MAVQTLEEAKTWLDAVGIALLFPKPDVVLPSLWEAVAEDTEVRWAVRDENGKYTEFTPEMERVWTWKDELPRHRHACVGLHVVRTTGIVAPRLVAAVYALGGRSGSPEDFREVELEPLEQELAEAALDLGRPTTRRELRTIAGREKREVDRAVNMLQRKLIFTNGGRNPEESGWSSTLHDLFARRWRARLKRLPTRDEALVALAESVLRTSGDLSVADLAAALRLRRPEALGVLEALEATGRADRRDEDGIAIWVSRAQRGRAAAGRGSSVRSRAAGSRSSPRRSR
jgi:hypothetical protein